MILRRFESVDSIDYDLIVYNLTYTLANIYNRVSNNISHNCNPGVSFVKHRSYNRTYVHGWDSLPDTTPGASASLSNGSNGLGCYASGVICYGMYTCYAGGPVQTGHAFLPCIDTPYARTLAGVKTSIETEIPSLAYGQTLLDNNLFGLVDDLWFGGVSLMPDTNMYTIPAGTSVYTVFFDSDFGRIDNSINPSAHSTTTPSIHFYFMIKSENAASLFVTSQAFAYNASAYFPAYFASPIETIITTEDNTGYQNVKAISYIGLGNMGGPFPTHRAMIFKFTAPADSDIKVRLTGYYCLN